MARSGLATAKLEYVPSSSPMRMAKAKSLSVEPPMSSIAMTGTSVTMVVLIVRTMTSLIEKLQIWKYVWWTPSRSCLAFSFMLGLPFRNLSLGEVFPETLWISYQKSGWMVAGLIIEDGNSSQTNAFER